MSAASGRLTSRPGAAQADGWPPGRHALDLGPNIEALLAVPDRDADRAALLLFFHGAGGHAAQSLSLVGEQALRSGVAVVATTSLGRTWDLLAGGLGRDVAVVDAALERTFGRYAVGRVAIGGFSDGASYALSMGLANGDLAEAVLAFSPGFVAAPSRTGRPRLWICHGRTDRVLSVDRCGRRVVAGLRGDYDVTYEEFDGGHVVPPSLVDAALAWWLQP